MPPSTLFVCQGILFNPVYNPETPKSCCINATDEHETKSPEINPRALKYPNEDPILNKVSRQRAGRTHSGSAGRMILSRKIRSRRRHCHIHQKSWRSLFNSCLGSYTFSVANVFHTCSFQSIQHSSHEIGYKLSFPTYLLQLVKADHWPYLQRKLLLHLINEDI